MAIALFGRLNEEWLRTFLELPHGIPSHDTLGRVFARLDAARFEECFRDWVQAAFKLTGGQVVPIDGKCLRGSHDRGPGPGTAASGGRLGRSQPPGAGPDGGGQQVQRDHGHPGVAAHDLERFAIQTQAETIVTASREPHLIEESVGLVRVVLRDTGFMGGYGKFTNNGVNSF